MPLPFRDQPSVKARSFLWREQKRQRIDLGQPVREFLWRSRLAVEAGVTLAPTPHSLHDRLHPRQLIG